MLEEIEADEIPTLLVMNKVDMLEDFVPRIDRDEDKAGSCLGFSANAMVSHCLQALTERLSGEIAHVELRLPPNEGRLRSRFYQLQSIEREWQEEDGSIGLEVRMPMVDWRRLCKQEQQLPDYVI